MPEDLARKNYSRRRRPDPCATKVADTKASSRSLFWPSRPRLCPSESKEFPWLGLESVPLGFVSATLVRAADPISSIRRPGLLTKRVFILLTGPKQLRLLHEIERKLYSTGLVSCFTVVEIPADNVPTFTTWSSFPTCPPPRLFAWTRSRSKLHACVLVGDDPNLGKSPWTVRIDGCSSFATPCITGACTNFG